MFCHTINAEERKLTKEKFLSSLPESLKFQISTVFRTHHIQSLEKVPSSIGADHKKCRLKQVLYDTKGCQHMSLLSCDTFHEQTPHLNKTKLLIYQNINI